VNGCGGRCDIRLGDLRDWEAEIPEHHAFDVVTGTPPYFELFGNVADDVNMTQSAAAGLDTEVSCADDQRTVIAGAGG
jgi:hypothetical protein